MNLCCTNCKSDNLVGEFHLSFFGTGAIHIVCCDCGSEYVAPVDMKVHTKLECPFKLSEQDNHSIEKSYKVSFKDTATGEHATLISREENGMRMTRLYHDEIINQMM